jgi:hypothetical protein
MPRTLSEPEWKVFRELRAIALERFCQRVLTQIDRITSEAGKSYHERYLAVYKLIERRDSELADAFNNPRRSDALRQLASIQSHELLTDEEMSRFSPETREIVSFLAGTRRD